MSGRGTDEVTSMRREFERGLTDAWQAHFADATAHFARARDQVPAHLDYLVTALDAFIQSHARYWQAEQALHEASQRFAVAVSALRRALNGTYAQRKGTGYLLHHDGVYQLNPMVTIQIDVEDFLALFRAILRRVESAFASAPAGLYSQRQQSLQRARSMLDHTLRPGSILTVARELPETPQQLANRPGHVPFQDTGRRDPAGGRHRIVLGRDVLAGTVGSFTDTSGHTFQGPAFGGRMPPRVFIRDNRQLLNPGNDPRLTGRLDVVQAIAINEGFLDAIRMQDAGILSTGMQQWSAHADLELAALLHRRKSRSPDEYMLNFGLYGLEVRAFPGQNGANSFMLQRVQPNGASADLPLAQRRAFFGGTTSGNVTSFRTDWAAQVREASPTSISYRATQILEAAARFDRVLREVGRIAVTMGMDGHRSVGYLHLGGDLAVREPPRDQGFHLQFPMEARGLPVQQFRTLQITFVRRHASEVTQSYRDTPPITQPPVQVETLPDPNAKPAEHLNP